MSDLSIILFFLIAIVASSFFIRLLPSIIPTPLIQIGLGYAISVLGLGGVQLEPELFLFLFLPPLLFLDAWKIQKRSFYENIKSIVNLAIGLVVFTVLCLGLLLHWLIPAIPLPVAFALAAILSPTDPVAISAISRAIPFPRRLNHILEGESLLNDASGLVCMRFAIVALSSGSFSLTNASATFVWLVVVGLSVGVLVSYVANMLDGVVSKSLGDDSNAQILLSLLIPFGAYFLAEKVGGSGVLAAVAAGLVMSNYDISHISRPTTRLRRNSVWEMLRFSLNGAMFILLGEQLPHIFDKASALVGATGHFHGFWLVLYAGLVLLALLCFRFLWVLTSLLFAKERQSMRMIWITAFSGVRGSITLAGVLSIPLVLDDGSVFPARDLIIFIAACVIIMSLILASVALPFLLRGLPQNHANPLVDQNWMTRKKAADAALVAIEKVRKSAPDDLKDRYDREAGMIAAVYAERRSYASAMTVFEQRADAAVSFEIERTLCISALHAERNVVQAEVRARRITDDIARAILHEIDLREEGWLQY